jgi:hypothetical protein
MRRLPDLTTIVALCALCFGIVACPHHGAIPFLASDCHSHHDHSEDSEGHEEGDACHCICCQDFTKPNAPTLADIHNETDTFFAVGSTALEVGSLHPFKVFSGKDSAGADFLANLPPGSLFPDLFSLLA